MNKTTRKLMYVLIFSFCMLLISLVYPYISNFAMTHRVSAAPGGELMLWLVPFMVCVGVNTAKHWKKGSRE